MISIQKELEEKRLEALKKDLPLVVDLAEPLVLTKAQEAMLLRIFLWAVMGP